MTNAAHMQSIRTAKGFMSVEYAIRIGHPVTEENLVRKDESFLAGESLNRFNDDELAELSRTVDLNHRMRNAKRYELSDRLRAEIKRWDETLDVLVSGKVGTWFESLEHRKSRALYRVIKGSAVPYPYESIAELT